MWRFSYFGVFFLHRDLIENHKHFKALEENQYTPVSNSEKTVTYPVRQNFAAAE